MTTTHAITFTGDLLDGFERAEVMARFAARFGLKGPQVDKVFCGKPVTLKKGLDEAKARAYVKALNELGMRTVSSSPFDLTEPPASAGYSIIFDGSVIAGHERDVVKRTAAQRLKFSDAQRERLFAGREVTMKRGLDEEKARHYAKTLSLLGMNARVEPPLPAAEPTSSAAPKPEPTPAPTAETTSKTAAAVTPVTEPDKPAADSKDAKRAAAEASLLQTQFSAAPAYDLEDSFNSSSALDDGAALHEGLRESPLAKPLSPAAEPAPDAAGKAAGAAAKGEAMMATVVNPDALKDYEDALADDPAIDALRAANDPSPKAAAKTSSDTTSKATPKKTTPEAAADALNAAAKSATATAKVPDTKVDKRDAASPVHEQDTVLAELDSAPPAAPKAPEPEAEEASTNHTVLVVLIVVAAAVAAWLLMKG